MMRMMLIAILLGCAGAAAAEDRETYIVELRNGSVHHGFIQYEDDRTIRLELDAPWDAPSVRTFRKDAIDNIEPEWSVERERRIRRGWEDRGRVEVQTVRGPRWLPRDEAAYAERAREMAARLLEAAPPATAMGPLDITDGDEVDDALADMAEDEQMSEAASEEPGVWSRWGLHAGIGLTGLLLLALIIRGLVLA